MSLFRKGKRLSTEEYLFIFKKNTFDYPRIGISIKKQFGNSVVRNYHKRILKEIFRKHKSIMSNFDIIIIKKKTIERKFVEREKEIEHIFRKISEY